MKIKFLRNCKDKYTLKDILIGEVHDLGNRRNLAAIENGNAIEVKEFKKTKTK